jgi:DNA-binding MarR family transcriptional regulator
MSQLSATAQSAQPGDLPPVSPARRSVVELLYTADTVRRRFLLVLAPHRVSLPQYNVLRILRGARGEPLATAVVAERMIEQAVAPMGVLERMEALGWIARVPAPEPGGALAWRLASGGEAMLQQVDPVLDAECARLMGPLGEADHRLLVEVLRAVRWGAVA